MEQAVLTEHARMRLGSRRIPEAAVDAALLFGRERHVRGATFYAIGRKEVKRYKETVSEIERFEGIQVVCAEDHVVVTAYRNRDFSGLRPLRPRRKGRGHGGMRLQPNRAAVSRSVRSSLKCS